MRKAFHLSLAFLLIALTSLAAGIVPTSTTASSTAPAPAMKATEVRIPVGNTGKFVTLQELATIKAADFEKLTGKKMGLMRRFEFKLAQRKLRRSINADGTINNQRLAIMAQKDMDGTTGFHLGGFALGFFLWPIGVLIAYLITDAKHDNRVKWAWIGFGVGVILLLIAVI
jgi:hypothetical protein